MLRTGLYKKVQIKSDEMCELKLMGTVRGLLKIYGIKIGTKSQFCDKTREFIQPLSDLVKAPLESLLSCIEKNEKALKKLDNKLIAMGEKDEDCKRLTTVTGVGVLTALTYISTIDHPERFEDSYDVGAYLGLTPKQSASGDTNRYGHIAKMGSKECRTALYEAAQCLLTRSKANSTLKAWGLRLMKKRGEKRPLLRLHVN